MAQFPSSHALKPLPRPTRRARVLVAEANSELRDAIVEALVDGGFDVLEFENGGDVTDFLVDTLIEPRRRADALVLDISLPGARGIQILDGLRSFDETTPCVLLAAHASPELHVRADELNAVVLGRPAPLSGLVDTVRSLIDHGDLSDFVK